ncbi:MAG: hypothetical protein ACKOJF_32835, partial [Planctomycetaceae bacterium]
TSQPVESSSEQGKLRWRATIGPCDGGLFLVAPRPVSRVVLKLAESAHPGERVPLTVHVVDPAGEPIDASIPVTLEVSDPQGRPAEISGHYATQSGQLQVELDLATNDQPGTWVVRAREGATGRVTITHLRVVPPLTPNAQP